MFLIPESENNFRLLVQTLKEGPVTAFIGAGLSAPMKPSWGALHRELQEAISNHTVRDFNAMFAPADFADFRDALDPETYLSIFRSRFGGAVSNYPDLYRFIDETYGFAQIATTNYDEFLASVALSHNRKPVIATYPDLSRIEARYVYLHGRAETAQLPADLVVCEDDYDRAYDSPGHASAIIKTLFLRPGLFIGSSLTDTALFALLRQRARHAESHVSLFAIVSVKTTDKSPNSLSDEALITTSRLLRLGVRAVCYARNDRHTPLRSILLQLRHEAGTRPIDALFFDRARQLGRLAAVEQPTQDDIQQVRELVRGVPELAKGFFEREDISLNWFDALKEAVIIPGVVDPWDIGEGVREVAFWPAAQFVRRLGPERPDAIVDLAQKLKKTRNWHAQSVLLNAASQIPTNRAPLVLPTLYNWMETSNNLYISERVAECLSSIAIRLSNDGEHDQAMVLLGRLLTPVRSSHESSSSLRLGEYHLLVECQA